MSAQPSLPDTRRLGAFLGAYRNIIGLAPLTAEPVTRSLTREDLSPLLESLSAGLSAARAGGAGFNVWAVAGLGRNEVRTSAVLSWLCDPNGSHGAGAAFAEAIWRRANGAQSPRFSLATLRRSLTEVCPLGDVSDRVDVVLEGDDFLVFIEVKIDAGLQPDQLGRYLRAARACADARGKSNVAVVYLSEIHGDEAADCLPIRWRSIGGAIREAAAARDSSFAIEAALQFARHVEGLH